MDGILQVHHAGLNTLDMTVMEEGFLEGLKHPEHFEAIRRDCHELEHQGLIKSEREHSQLPTTELVGFLGEIS